MTFYQGTFPAPTNIIAMAFIIWVSISIVLCLALVRAAARRCVQHSAGDIDPSADLPNLKI
jgi:hypothetical protein